MIDINHCSNTSIYKYLLVFLGLFAFTYTKAGDSLQINDISIEGLTKTKEWVLLRELSIQKGSKIAISDTSTVLEQNKKQILNCGLFTAATIHIRSSTLYLRVKEKWYFFPIPVIDVADRNLNQWLLTKDPRRLIYGTELILKNVGGLNHTLTSNLTLGYTKQADVKYLIPVIKRNQNVGFEFQAAYMANKEVWLETVNNKVRFYNNVDEVGIKRAKASAGLIRRKGINQYQYYRLKWENARTTDTIVRMNPEFLSNSNSMIHMFSANYNFVLDRRDIRSQPTKGNYFNLNLDLNYIQQQSQFIPVLNYRSSHFKPLGGRWYGSLGVHAKLSTPAKQPYRYNRAVGYEYNVLRGYEYYVVDGANSGVLKTNLKYALMLNKKVPFNFIPVKSYKEANNTLFLLAFYDAGYVNNDFSNSSNTFTNRYLNGYGVGLEWVVWYSRMVRFELARNHINELGFYVSFKMGV